jgi:hypothetical protein
MIIAIKIETIVIKIEIIDLIHNLINNNSRNNNKNKEVGH